MRKRIFIVECLFVLGFFFVLSMAVGFRLGLDFGNYDLDRLQTELVINSVRLENLKRDLTLLEKHPWAADTLTGTASWYGDPFHGRLTANGEIYNKNEFTVAHPTLPLGTIVVLENTENGKMAPAVITDRGPYIDGRVFDLSEGLAKRLGFYHKGLAEVRMFLVKNPNGKE